MSADMEGRSLTPCQQEDADAWFEAGDDDRELKRSEARKLCLDVCPVREACLELAMEAEWGKHRTSRWGIFGGLTASERMAEEKRRRDEEVRV